MNHTPLYDEHLKLQAKMVDFSGWEMPLHYGSQIDEHHCVRQEAGMFDVSHMSVVDIQGIKAKDFLSILIANDVDKLKLPGKALYTCMLNEKAGIIDDLIVYFMEPNFYRLVVNAGTREKDFAWIQQQSKPFGLTPIQRKDLAMIAVQGPQAITRANALFSAEEQTLLMSLKIFQGIHLRDFWIARTGYTGEEGYEVILPATRACEFWQDLLSKGIKPCGLGARDTLRLEAGLNLYGSDMDENTHPFESNLSWTVSFEQPNRHFIGRKALESQKSLPALELVGLVLEDKGVMRAHQKVTTSEGKIGEITSGTFSPSLQKSIALARIPITQSSDCLVEIRDKPLKARIVKPPFVRNGKGLV